MVQKGSVAPAQTFTPYELLSHSVKNDTRWKHDLAMGKRVGYYRMVSDIGSGNFSQVKLGVHQLTKDKVAVKIIDKNKLDNKTRKMLAREIATMETICHPNVIRLFEVIETFAKIHLVTEYARGGELFNKITSEGKLAEFEAKYVFSQIVLAVQFMHTKGFIHRDIKAENVFYAAPNYVKLGDFGFSTKLIDDDEFLRTFCGSPPYAAPELFRDQHYIGRWVDTWALGVLLYFIVTGNMPFRANTVAKLKDCILNGKYSVPEYVPNTCGVIIKNMLHQIPSVRISLDEVLESEWLKTVDISLFRAPHQKYLIEPSVTDDADELSAVEVKTRKKLEAYGITMKMLRDSVDQTNDTRNKSPVLGIYRIIAHRLQHAVFEACRDRKEFLMGKNDSRMKIVKKSTFRKKIARVCTLI